MITIKTDIDFIALYAAVVATTVLILQLRTYVSALGSITIKHTGIYSDGVVSEEFLIINNSSANVTLIGIGLTWADRNIFYLQRLGPTLSSPRLLRGTPLPILLAPKEVHKLELSRVEIASDMKWLISMHGAKEGKACALVVRHTGRGGQTNFIFKI